METDTPINETLKAMGFILAYTNLHVASSRFPGRDTYNNSLRCRVTLSIKRNGKEVPFYEGDYHMGLAHIRLIDGALFPHHRAAAKIIGRTTSHHPLSAEDIALLNHVVSTSKLTRPVLSDVLYCVWMDGSNALAGTFEEWCDDFGMSTDSRSAYDAYNRDIQTGLRLRQRLTSDELAKLAELFADY